ncbi:tau 95 subunit of transcription factor TFIIIC [Elasticomyces elasticus]|nr:tau 95 subunit of transcription factor TFIIIC [Elasticomyces elasticus]
MNLNSIKQFNPDLQPGFLPEADVAPPARFSNFHSGANYLYLQNPSVMTRVDHDGELVTQNRNLIPKRVVSSVAADVGQVPQGPKQQLKPTRGYERYIQKTVDELEKVLKERPVVTRRVALNAISEDNESTFKEATQYVGYSFSSGPWKDALIKYGVDPRTDPKYRFYQTLSFQLVPRNENSRKGPDAVGPKEWLRSERWRKDTSKSHIFDGQSIVPNGKTWQICDITDPMLRKLLHIEDVATECDVDRFGWYHSGTWSKVRVIMRDKIRKIMNGQIPDDSLYGPLLEIPEDINPSNIAHAFPKDLSIELSEMAQNIRNMTKHGVQSRLVAIGNGSESDFSMKDGLQANSELAVADTGKGENFAQVRGNDDEDDGEDDDGDDDDDEEVGDLEGTDDDEEDAEEPDVDED